MLLLRRFFPWIAGVTAVVGLTPPVSRAQGYDFTTLAGRPGAWGYVDGTGTSARFHTPAGMTAGSDGKIYVTDAVSSTIRSVTPEGVVTTVAGSAERWPGSVDGPVSIATFAGPMGVARDHDGNLYVCDTGNHTVRKISAAGIVSTLAGLAETKGSSDGEGSAARFNEPNGIAIDANGNLYVADTRNHTIRKISPAGEVTTLAGLAGSMGSNDGAGTAARFNVPRGVALEPGGTLVVADTNNCLLRRITMAGVVTTITGKALEASGVDGGLAEARLYLPYAVTVDASGRIFFAEPSRVRMVTLDGMVLTIGGARDNTAGSTDGIGPAARFAELLGIAVDAAGRVYVTDSYNSTIRQGSAAPLSVILQPQSQIARVGTTIVLSVGGSSNSPVTYQWRKNGVAIGGATGPTLTLGNAQTSDSGSYDVVIRDSTTSTTSDAAKVVVAQPPANDLFANRTIIPGASYGVLTTNIAADRESDESLHAGLLPRATIWWTWTAPAEPSGLSGEVTVSTEGSEIDTVLAVYQLGAVGGWFDQASDVAPEGTHRSTVTFVPRAGATYTIVVDGRNGAMGQVALNVAYTSPRAPTYTQAPQDISVRPGANVKLAVTAAGGSPLLYKWRKDGVPLPLSYEPSLSLWNVSASDVGVYDVVVSNTLGQIVTTGATLTLGAGYTLQTVAGSVTETGATDGAANSARFSSPSGIAVDAAGNIFIADQGNDRIRKITPDGIVSTIAGTYGITDGADGVGVAAHFYRPAGLALDGDGNLYVTEIGNHTIRMITPARVVSTVAGSAGKSGSADGTGSLARFNEPRGIAVDRAGNLYVADSGNHTIRRIARGGVVTTVAGKAGQGGRVDALGAIARFSAPYGVAVGQTDGLLYVADQGNQLIRTVELPTATQAAGAGLVRTFAGGGGGANEMDGAGTAAGFSSAFAIASDASGNLFVGSFFSLRKISADGVVTTIAGGSPPLNYVYGVAVGPAGKIYIADANNHVVEMAVPPKAPQIESVSAATATVRDGDDWSVRVKVSGAGPFTYQWRRDGVAIAGATNATYAVSRAGVQDNGYYSVVVSGADGMATSGAVRLAVTGSPRLANIATRAYCGAGDRVTIGGFVVAGRVSKRVLIRAVGPSLAAQGLGVAELLADPMIEVHAASRGNAVIATNDDWRWTVEWAQVASTAANIGAAPLLDSDTTSAALVVTLDPGVYSFVVNGKNGGSGVVLVEVYEADSQPVAATFSNIATRAYATTGNGVTIGGFVITGNAPKRVLLRAVGKTLTKQGLGVTEVLADPVMELHDAINGNVTIATNDNWGANANAAAITTTGARIGATPLDQADTTSSALLVTLQPGVYSFIAKGKDPAPSGIVLVEVYDAD